MLLDIGIGIFMALITGGIFDVHTGAFLIIAGVTFSLIKDADALINLIIYHGSAESYRHRDLFHLPLIYIPVGTAVIFFLPIAHAHPLSFLFAICSLAHFIHDSIGLGWGVQWLYPFSSDQYSFFYQYNAHKAGLRPNAYGLYVWKFGEIASLEEKYGDKDWFRKIYLRAHPYSLVETAFFLLSVVALLLVRG